MLTTIKNISKNIFPAAMNQEISKLEATLLNIESSQQPLLDKITEYDNQAAAAISRKLVELPNIKRVITQVIPATYNGIGITHGVSITGPGEAPENTEEVHRISRGELDKYKSQKEKIIENILNLGEKTHDAQVNLAQYTSITQVSENRSSDHAHLFVVREKGIYLARVIHGHEIAIPESIVTPETLIILKKRMFCNTYEVTHPSRLADEIYMAAFATRHVQERMDKNSARKN